MASVSGASKTELEGFYSTWKGNLRTDIEERVAFTNLSDEDQKTVLKALQVLVSKSEVAEGPTAQELNNVLSKLKSDYSPIRFREVTTAPGFVAANVNRSFQNIIRLKEILPTPQDKVAIQSAEKRLGDIFRQHPLLQKLFGQPSEEGVVDPFVNSIIARLDVNNGQIDIKDLCNQLEKWVKKTIPATSLQKMALEYVDEMREREQQARSGKEKPFSLNIESAERQISFFKSRLATSYVTFHPELRNEDIAALGAFGVKGQSEAHVVRDCFIALGEAFMAPLQQIKTTFQTQSKGEIVAQTVKDLSDLFSSGGKMVGSLFYHTFQFALTALQPWKWRSGLSSIGSTILIPFQGIFERIANRPENQVYDEIKALQTKVENERAALEKAVGQAISTIPQDEESQEQMIKSLEPTLERLLAYTADVNLLLGLMDLRENLSEKGYVLLPHLATRHGANLRDQSNLLLSHLGTALDMVSILQDPTKWPGVSQKMKQDGSTPVLAYRALVKEGVFNLSPSRLETEQQASHILDRSMLWLEYARSRGDAYAPIYLAEIIATNDPLAWSADHADNTFAQARQLLGEAIAKGDSVQKRLAQDNMKVLLQLRLDAAIKNGKSPEEQARAAHYLIEGMKYINGLQRQTQIAVHGKKVGNENADVILKNDLFRLASIGSEEAALAIVQPIAARIKEGRLNYLDIRTLAGLATKGFKLPLELLKDPAQMASFISQVKTAAKNGELSHLQFRSLAILAAHGNPKAKEVLEGFLTLTTPIFKDNKNEDEMRKNIALADFALKMANGEVVAEGASSFLQEEEGLEEFSQAFLHLDPLPRQIPAFNNLQLDLNQINARVRKGTFTEKDVNDLLEGVRYGNKGAQGVLTTIVNQKQLVDARMTETLDFAKWVLEVALPLGFSEQTEVKGIGRIGFQFEPQVQKNFQERYQKLLDPTWMAPVMSRTASMSSTLTASPIELDEDMPPVTLDRPRPVVLEEVQATTAPMTLEEMQQLSAKMKGGDQESGKKLLQEIRNNLEKGWVDEADVRDVAAAIRLNVTGAMPLFSEILNDQERAFGGLQDEDLKDAKRTLDLEKLNLAQLGFVLALPMHPRRLSTLSRANSAEFDLDAPPPPPPVDLFEEVARGKIEAKHEQAQEPASVSTASSLLSRFTMPRFSPFEFFSGSSKAKERKMGGNIGNFVHQNLGPDSPRAQEIAGMNIFDGKPIIVGVEGEKRGLTKEDIEDEDTGKVVSALIEAIHKDADSVQREQQFIAVVEEIDGWIETLKGDYSSPQDKARVDEMAPEIFSYVLGSLLFPHPEMSLGVGVGKDAVAEFIVRNRKEFLSGE